MFHVSSQVVLPCSLKVQAWGGRPQTVDTAAAAAAAAAAHTAKLLRVPLWQHALKASAIIGVAVAGAVVMAKLLHEEADKAEAGEVSPHLVTH